MILNQATRDHVENRTFSDHFEFRIEPSGQIQARMEYVESLVRGRSIIHLGCVDHLPLINEKRRNKEWFHERLTDASGLCLGVDINREGIRHLKDNLGVPNVIYGDIISDDIPDINSLHWDYLVAGEILEHIDNPVHFLEQIRRRYAGIIDKMIITVPNAMQFHNVKMAMRRIEGVNSDHRYWFTPYTLTKVIHQAGMHVEQLELCMYTRRSGIKYRLKRKLLSKFPLFCDNIVAVCSIPKNSH